MTLSDHIRELRAELSWNDDAAERTQIESELAQALAADAEGGQAFDAWLAGSTTS